MPCCVEPQWSEREGGRSATMASAGPSRHLPVEEPSTRRGGSAALLSSVANRRDASPRGRGSNQCVRAGAVAAAGANRRRSREVRRAHARLCQGRYGGCGLFLCTVVARRFLLAQRSQDKLHLIRLRWSHWVHKSSWGRSHLEVMGGLGGPSTIQLSLLIFKLHISFLMIKKYGYCL